nr:HXXEE domain-containing protein [Lysinibacillus timonensis]
MFLLDLSNAIWLFVVIFMLHDFEEIITVENWAKRTENIVREKNSRIGRFIWNFWNVNSHSFAKRDVFIFLIASIITLIKVQFLDSAWVSVFYLAFLFFVLIHNVAHVLQSVYLKVYTPGLYTAILLVTPYVIYLISRLI